MCVSFPHSVLDRLYISTSINIFTEVENCILHEKLLKLMGSTIFSCHFTFNAHNALSFIHTQWICSFKELHNNIVMILMRRHLVQDETGVYKNLLQEIAQRVGAPLPQYTTFRSGLGHLPVFTGTVELAGITFTGDPAKNKKQAEKNAAMAAWSSLKQCESLHIGLDDQLIVISSELQIR